jgi:hypothetical protein
MMGVVLCGALAGYTTCGQLSASVGVSVPLPSVEVNVGLPSLEIRAEGDFYQPLSPYGQWAVIGSYGRCWRPGRVAADWRPYCNGNWQRTDAGWYWVSDEPWAWATYHYGRWDFSGQYGWYWVPQTRWAPAWVSWHQGGGYVGWAPLQPSVSISAGGFVGFDGSRILPRAFVFVKQGRFLDPIRPATVAVNNAAIINKTVNITNSRIVNNAVFNGGPATALIEKASGRKVRVVAVRELRRKEEAGVLAKQKTPPTTAQKKAGAPVRSEVEPREKKTAAAHTPPPVEKPAAATQRSAAPAPKNHEAQSQRPKPAPAAARSNPAVKSEARAEGAHPAAIREPTRQNADKPFEKPERPAKSADQKMQGPAKEKPAASEQKEASTAGKSHENKAKE